MSKNPKIAVVGATGAVGVEMLQCLEERKVPCASLTLLSSARSAGKKMSFRGEDITVRELRHDSFEGIDIALFSAGGKISQEFARAQRRQGRSSLIIPPPFGMDPDVPLVIPEINPSAAQHATKGIIANPNCTTIISLMGLYPLHRAFGP